MRRFISGCARQLLLVLGLGVGGHASAALTVTPIAWDIVGLDSNSPTTGPRNFPMGMRVCSTTLTAATVSVAFNFTTAQAGISLRAGSANPVVLPQIGVGACRDAYFEVAIDPVIAPYGLFRRYSVTATEGINSATSPIPRQIFVERLVSQSRNSISNMEYRQGAAAFAPVAAGGALNLVVGNTYDIRITGATATQGYEQFSAFVNFSNTVFRVNAVTSTYSANTAPPARVPNPNDKLYADACLWQPDPNSPAYSSCLGSGKTGGSFVTTYNLTILSGGGTTETLNTLIYDFSGSSYHYNADFSAGARFANILSPASSTITKNFTPSTIATNGQSTLTFVIGNPTAAAVSGYSFTDNFPAGVVIATPPAATTSGCGTPTFAPVAGAATVSMSGATVGANSTCTVTLKVTSAANGVYNNTVLFGDFDIDGVDAGVNAGGNVSNTATLTVQSTVGSAPTGCAGGTTLALWGFAAGGTNVSPTVNPGFAGPATPIAGGIANSGANSPGMEYDAPIAAGWTADKVTVGVPPAAINKARDEYYEFQVDTTGRSSVTVSFNYSRSTQGARSMELAIGAGATLATYDLAVGTSASTVVSSGLNPAGLTVFRLYVGNADNDNNGANVVVDEVRFAAPAACTPATLTKAFNPTTVGINQVSQMTFTITNPNATALTGVGFTDVLPAGMEVAPTPGVTASGCTVSNFTPVAAAGNTSLALSGAGVAASPGACTISVNVRTTSAGSRTNIAGSLASNETGTISGPTGTASASLTTVAPPTIAMNFGTDPILTGGTSVLTYTITNPNPSAAIAGIAFTNTFPVAPGAMTVFSNAAGSQCGGTFTGTAGGAGVTFTGGALAAGASCTITVTVTAPTVGTYTNTTSTVSHLVNAVAFAGNAATDTLVVNASSPKILVLKQVGTNLAGPFFPYLAVALGTPVFYQFTIENAGDTVLNRPAGGFVSDPTISGEEACVWPATLPVADAFDDGHIATCVIGPYNHSFPGVTNTATATFVGAVAPAQTDTSTAVYQTKDINVIKAATPLSYGAAGDLISYSITVTNSGAATLSSPLTINDPLTSNESCPPLSSVGDLDNFFDPNEVIVCTANYTIVAADLPPTASQVNNTATVTFPEISKPSNMESVFFVPPPTPAFLVVSKSITPLSIVPGGSGTYTVTVSNAADFATTANILIHDTLPIGVTFVPAGSGGVNWTCDGAVPLTCTFTGILAPDASTALTINFTTSPSTNDLTNTARASGGGDPDCVAPPAGPVPDHCLGTVVATTNPVTLSDVDSSIENGQLVVRFGTAIEAGTLGYRVLTDRPGDATLQALTAGVLPAQVSTLLPQRYEARGSYVGQTQIYIEEIAVSGVPKRFGPFPIGVLNGNREISVRTDWAAIGAEQAGFRELQAQAFLNGRSASAQAEVRVNRDGWVQVSHEELLARGINWSGLEANRIQLSRGADLLPVNYQGPAQFGPGSKLSFLAKAVSGSLYTKTAVYRLRYVSDSATALPGVHAGTGALPRVTAMPDAFEHAPNRTYDFASPADDPWYAFRAVRVNAPLASNSETFSLPAKAAGASGERLTVDLYGGLDFPETPDHSVRIKLNGTTLASRQFDGVTRQQIGAELPAGLLLSGNNTLTLELVADTNVYADIVNVAGIKVEYQRQLTAIDDRLNFTVPAGSAGSGGGDGIFASAFESQSGAACTPSQVGCMAWQVAGFTRNDLVVLRERADGSVQQLTGVEINPVGAGYSVAFASLSAPGDRYWIEPAAGISRDIVGSLPLSDPLAGGAASYLIVSHPSFIDRLAPLVSARRAEGYSVRVLDVEDLYRHYSAGSVDPTAIKRALTEAYSRLGTRFVLLVGGDSYDYMNYAGSNSISFIPTYYRQSDWLVRYAPADSVYADVDDDGRADLAVGRFPVRSSAELDSIIAKTLAYAQANHAGKLLRLTDRNDGNINFSALANPLVNALGGWSASTISLQSYPTGVAGVQQARDAMVTAVNSGQSLLAYFGHSAPNGWTRESLVTAQLVYGGLFNNAAVPTVAWQLGCWGTYFVDPYHNTVAHGLMLQSNGGGAAAIIGASALTEIGSDITWITTLAPHLRTLPIGEAMRRSQRTLHGLGPSLRDVDVGGALLGDPALRVRQ